MVRLSKPGQSPGFTFLPKISCLPSKITRAVSSDLLLFARPLAPGKSLLLVFEMLPLSGPPEPLCGQIV